MGDYKPLKSDLELLEHNKYPLDSTHERIVKSEKVDDVKVDGPELGIVIMLKELFPKRDLAI